MVMFRSLLRDVTACRFGELQLWESIKIIIDTGVQWAPYLPVSAGHLHRVQLKFALMSSWTCVSNNVWIYWICSSFEMMPDFYKHTYHFNMTHGERLLMHHRVRRWGESMEEGHFVSAALWWLDWMCSSHRWRPCIHWQLPQISEVFPAFRLNEGKLTVLFLCFTKSYKTKLLYKASSSESVSQPELKRLIRHFGWFMTLSLSCS